MDTLQDVFRGSSQKEVDYIQYSIYLPPKSSDADMLSYLQDTLDMINSTIQPLIKDYIWQKDKFHLSIAYDQSNDPSYPFLFGISRFGDCINDEWFIVYLLQHVSNQVPEAVISLVDNDGDVLLIEAALDLPSWLDPSNSQNRVYLQAGKVHIIPLPSSPADILSTPTSGHLSRQTAIDLVRQRKPLASSAIQTAIKDRTREYPNAAKKEIHCATCLLPNKAAFVLLLEPQLITLAIEAFYLRDPISLKACASMKTFSPAHTTQTTIKFTKTTYAQTVSQKFYAPKPFRLPSISQKKQHKDAELGMKVACGLEMLYHSSTPLIEDERTTNVEDYNFEKDKKYEAYIQHSIKLGYFRSEKKGSQLYKLLEHQSKEQYLKYKAEAEANASNKRYVDLDDMDVDDEDTFQGSHDVLSNGSSNIHKRIDILLSQYSEEALNKLIAANILQEDSDDWMNVDPQQLEELLMKRMGNMQSSMMEDLQKDFGGASGAGARGRGGEMDLEAMMNNLENFVENSKSGVEGVEFPQGLFGGEQDEGSEYDSEEEYYEDEEENNLPIQFDVDKFMSILRGDSSSQRAAQEDKEEEENELMHVMQEMDQEIQGHDKLSGSFAKLSTVTDKEKDMEEAEEDESAPVDVQLNLVKNVLESFKSQQGLPGPVGNLLSQFGFVLPGDNEEQEN